MVNPGIADAIENGLISSQLPTRRPGTWGDPRTLRPSSATGGQLPKRSVVIFQVRSYESPGGKPDARPKGFGTLTDRVETGCSIR